MVTNVLGWKRLVHVKKKRITRRFTVVVVVVFHSHLPNCFQILAAIMGTRVCSLATLLCGQNNKLKVRLKFIRHKLGKRCSGDR